MEKRYAERRTLWLWMLWKRKLFAQYWMRFESTRDNGPKREQVSIQWDYTQMPKLFPRYKQNTHANGQANTHTNMCTHNARTLPQTLIIIPYFALIWSTALTSCCTFVNVCVNASMRASEFYYGSVRLCVCVCVWRACVFIHCTINTKSTSIITWTEILLLLK